MNHRKYNHLKQFNFDALTADQQKFILEYEIEKANEQQRRREILEEQAKKGVPIEKTKIVVDYDNVKKWFEQFYLKMFNKEFQYTEDNKLIMDLLFYYFAKDIRFEEFNPRFKLNKGIGIIGSVGTGKTTTMQAFEMLGNNFFKAYKSPFFLFKINSCNKISLEYQSREDKRDITNYCYGARCFDDLGSEKNVFGDKSLMEQILEQRYFEQITLRKQSNITHFTTNLNLDELALRYGDRVFDRLQEQCNFIPLNGASFRR